MLFYATLNFTVRSAQNENVRETFFSTETRNSRSHVHVSCPPLVSSLSSTRDSLHFHFIFFLNWLVNFKNIRKSDDEEEANERRVDTLRERNEEINSGEELEYVRWQGKALFLRDS